ncbi:MAG: hypothetical protein HY823_15805 [Acidobacteria bacterium]|nr:hypothetical protein [Acidobacteriota bacterium]
MNGSPESRSSRRMMGRVLFGLILVALGAALLLDNLGYLHLQVSYRWWPLALVLLAVVRMVERGFLRVGPHFLLFLGLFLLAGFLEREDLIERWWPMAIVWLGVLVTLRALLPKRKPDPCENLPEGTP